MGFSRFFIFLTKVETSIVISRTAVEFTFQLPCLPNPLHGICSSRSLGSPIFTQKQNLCDYNPSGILSNQLHNPSLLSRCEIFGSNRSIHRGSTKAQTFTGTDEENPNLRTDRIAEDTEKFCKIFSQYPKTSDIESSLSRAQVEVSPILVTEVLKKLSNAGVLALAFFRWAEKREGFKYTTESYNYLIEALGKIKQFKLIWNLVDAMKKNGLLTKETFLLIIRRYARAKKVKEAIETFERMENFGMKPELPEFNSLIDTLSKSRSVKKAQEVFDKMSKRRFMPDIKTYTVLLEGWGQEQSLLRLKEVYREMRDEGFEPDVVTYGIIINAYCKSRKIDEAIELFNEMEAKNCKPSQHIYCILINGLGSEKRLKEALEFFERSKASCLVPDIPTYNAIVGSYCWSMRFQDAYQAVEEMRECGVGPNSRTYDIILHHLIKAGRTREAYSVFERMCNESGCDPSLNTYTIIVRMLCDDEQIDMALRVWDQMKARGVLPAMHMFLVLISCLCNNNKLDDACKHFQDMLDLGIRPTAQMYSNLKQALLDEGKEDIALILGQRLEKLRGTPLVG